MLKSIILISGGNAFAQVITIALMPLLSRLYSPDAFGVQATFISYSSIMAALMTLSINQAIPIEKRHFRARCLCFAVFINSIIQLTLSTIVLLIMVYFHYSAIFGLNLFYALFIPLAAFLTSMSLLFVGIAIRLKRFNLIAISGGLTSSIAVLRLVFGYIRSDAVSLIIAQLLGLLLSISPFLLRVSWRYRFRQPRLTSVSRSILRYKDFVSFRMPQGVLNMLSHSLPVILITGHYGTEAAGAFALAMSTLGVPAAIFTQAISNSFTSRIADLRNTGHGIRETVMKLTLATAIIAAPPFILIAVLSPMAFPIIFGAQWGMSGELAQFVALSSFFMFINKPAVIGLTVERRQHILLIYEFISIFSKFLLYYISINMAWSVITFVACISISAATLYCALVFAGIYSTNKGEQAHVGTSGKAVPFGG